jgi:hypothetical protein
LAGKTDSEIADVDHLLDFAEAFGFDLANLERHQPPQGCFFRAQRLAEPADQLAAARPGNVAPDPEGGLGAADLGPGVLGFHDPTDARPVDRRAHRKGAALEALARHAERGEQFGDFSGDGHSRLPKGRRLL